jgi:hypothetical protein
MVIMTKKEELIKFIEENIDNSVTKSLKTVQTVINVDKATNKILENGYIINHTYLGENEVFINILKNNFSHDLQGHLEGDGTLLRIDSWEVCDKTL